jgi:hypothetical protein
VLVALVSVELSKHQYTAVALVHYPRGPLPLSCSTFAGSVQCHLQLAHTFTQ